MVRLILATLLTPPISQSTLPSVVNLTSLNVVGGGGGVLAFNLLDNELILFI